MYQYFTQLLFLISLFYFISFSEAQEMNDTSELTLALEEGSSKAISRFFEERLEISLDNDKKDFSKSQAEIVLRDFFKNNPSKGFELVQDRRSNENNIYLIGIYHSINTVFRVFIKGKAIPNKNVQIYSLYFISE